MRVSVVMPVRDGERFLREAVESILGQTIPGLELVVVDDGSTDSTPAILAELVTRDDRVRVERQAAEGLTSALNTGCALAKAPLIARMDADDVALPDRLERQLSYLDAHPGVALVAGGIVLVDESGRELDREPGQARPDLLTRNDIVHPTVVVRAEALRALGGYRFDQAEDYDLWLRLDERYGIAVLPEPVLCYRLHAGQFSVAALERQALGALAVRAAARERRAGRPDPLAGVERLDESLVERRELNEAVVADAVHWAATLVRAGREAEAGELLDAAAAVPGAPSRSVLAQRAQLLLLKRAVRQGRVRESAMRLVAWARA